MAGNSILDYLENFERHSNGIAYVNRGAYRTTRWTYGKTLHVARQFARELDQRQITKGDRVLIWGENSAEWVAAFLGCALQGAIVVPIDDIATPDFVGRVAQQVEAKLLLAARKHQSQAAEIPFIPLEDLPSKVAGHSAADKKTAVLQRQDILEIVFTSGTTAEPKGVVITHGNVLANLEPLETEMRAYLKYEWLVHPIRFLHLLPLSHVFGQFLGIFLPPLLGGSVIFQDSLGPSEIVRTIKQERVSVLVTVPRILQSLKEKLERDSETSGTLEEFRRRFSASEGKHFLHRWWIFRDIHRRFGWKFWAFICGGSALDGDTEEFWGRLGYAVIQGYGLTETTSLISVNHPFKLGKGSVGKVLAGREIKLDENGEILVRGGGVASAYWSSGELKPVAGEEGWYHTGDLGELDAEGNLHFKGRKKDVIVTPAGMNVYPEDLEAALRRQPEVKDCVVIGLRRGGNAEPCAVLILRDSANPAQVIARANQSLAEYQRIHNWFVWPEQDFPRTSTQKPKVAVIQQTVEAGLREERSGSHHSPLAQMIQQITGRTPSSLAPDASLETDLNLSSLDRVALMSALEDRYQVDLTQTTFSNLHTVADLERTLRGEGPPSAEYHYPGWALRWPVTWIRNVVHYLLLRPAVFLLGWPRIYGRENLRGVKGPALVISNHVSDVDVGFILTALPARFRHRLAAVAGGEAMEVLRTPPPGRAFLGRIYDRIRWTLGAALLNLFPLPREAGFRQSFAYAGEAVDRGYSILVFPEGRHTATGQLLPFRAGIGILANSLGVPIIPMRIDGLFELKHAGKKFAPPGRISVHIGAPVHFEPGTPPEKIAEELHKIVSGI
ncbi:MAG TPA: AMP-binding protein [Terriglobales bacterium]|nr:AMP-binding protein [Terriglobales bacterium]